MTNYYHRRFSLLIIIAVSFSFLFSSPVKAQTPLLGTKKVAVILFNFRDDVRKPFLKADVEAKTFTNPDSVSAYWREVSFGKLNLTGKVFDWVKIPTKKPGCLNMTDQAKILDNANQLAKTIVATAHAEGYNYYVLVAPQFCLKIPDARVDGFFVPGTNFTFFNGNIVYKVFETVHELGHAFGLGHANALDCHIFKGYTNGQAIFSSTLPGADNALCQPVGYSDPLSVMGNFSPGNLLGYGEPPHISAFQKMALGWLDQSTVQTVTQSGTYDIQPAEISSNQAVIRIPIDRGQFSLMGVVDPSNFFNSTDQLYYYLDYRIPYGIFDTPSSGQGAGFGGVRLFIGKDFVQIPTAPTLESIGSLQTYLVDVTPSSPSLFDAVIKPGNPFEDLERAIKIETLSTDPTRARVKISLPSFFKVVEPQGVQFLGQILPLRVDVSIPSGTEISWKSRGLDNNLKIRISLDKDNGDGVIIHYDVHGLNNEIKISDHGYTFFLTDNIPPGQYFFTVDAMDGSTIVTSAKSGLITIVNKKLQVPQPNFWISDAYPFSITPTSVQAGGAAVLSDINVVNDGQVDSGVGNLGLYLSRDAIITTNDILLQTISLPRISHTASPSNSYTIRVPTFIIPADTPAGNYYVGAIVDPSNEISESNENDNALVKTPLTVTAPALPTVSITSPVAYNQSVTGSFPLSATFSAPSGGYIKQAKLFIDSKLDWTSSPNPTSPITRHLPAVLPTSVFTIGSHTVKFTVTDDKGQTASAERSIKIIASPPPPPLSDTTPPMLLLQNPKLGATVTNKATNILVRADDPSGVRSTSIKVTPAGMAPLSQTCSNQYRPGLMYCSLTVPANQWVGWTLIDITATDNSSNQNIASEQYIISSGQLMTSKQDIGGSKIIVPSKSQCHTFTTNLSFGMSGSEVMALQNALTRAGFPVNTTGTFDEATASAVSSFQLANKNELLTANGLTYPTGYFGLATRQKLNQLWGCG